MPTQNTQLLVMLFIMAALLSACAAGSSANPANDAPEADSNAIFQAAPLSPEDLQAREVREDAVFRIVTTTTQATDLTSILAEGVEDLEISALMGAGVDPHLYQPTESDVEAMNQADMVIYSGLHLEGQFDAVFEALSAQGVLIYSLSRPVKEAGFVIGAFDVETEQLGADDPHFWFDPRNWELTTQDLAETFAALDSENAEIYLGNAEVYSAQLQSLYDWADSGMGGVPGGQRYLVTSHDAFQYFGAAFGWRMAAIQGLSTEDEAGVGDIQNTVDFVIDNNIPVLFVESSIPPDTIEAVQEAIEAEGGSARVGVRELYSDAMGEPGTFGGTYTGMIAENVYTILQSYRCAGVDLTIPEWPTDLQPTPPDDLINVACE
ncbi:MAG: zinc ABC transporter solute-binding protein [Chloroflexi bacterium]|nr:zinc ABC transporter solute-binding protein [Chloroflexota bacterium]